MLILAGLLGLTIMLVSAAAARTARLKQAQQGALVLCALAYSVGPVAYPFVQLNFSESVFAQVVLIDLVLFVSVMVLGPAVAASYDSSSRLSVNAVIRTILTDVLLLSVIAATVLNTFRVDLPVFVTDSASYIGASFSFLVTVYLALSLKMPDIRQIRLLGGFVMFRLIAAMVGAFAIAAAVRADTGSFQALLLTFFTPVSTFPLVYTSRHRLDSELVAQLSLLSRIIVLILYPVLMAVLLEAGP
ncbi:MAG: hypothetical protein TR69_WS6001000247 [candidate division WS6 bacterium OLB20]|uniref:Membrane transport protein n=1 Tax=candidate division WS6 bacterium OLB20 TaxID=1617426 RepID=A0A136M0E3_9BACT|nr:MAG: hypothetical protein TR69_WS6001000247 [candidate division WS6 bacterium OLB20]